MKAFAWSYLCFLAFVSTAFAAKFPANAWKDATKQSVPGNAVPNKFIVEVADAADIPGKRSLHARAPHEALYHSLRKRDVGFKVDKEFNHQGIFVGASVTLDNANVRPAMGVIIDMPSYASLQDQQKIAQIAGVKAVRPVVRIPGPKPVSMHVVTGVNDPALPPDSESTHILTRVDKLHAQGIAGKGVKIGMISLDTGIDHTHPTLGGGIGPGFKIIGGFDFVGDAFDGSNTPVPDPDPLDQCNGHGTHVAGIIGADPVNPFNISGVAFQASLTSYRIFGCGGSTTDDVIIEALLRGVSEGQDILTMSLGGSDGWTESSASVVSSRISDTGKIVTIAAGNDGSKGAFYTSSPGNAISAISVASLDNTVIELQNATVHGATHDPITYFATFPFPVTQTLPIFVTSTDTTVIDDACDPLPDSTPDLSGFVTIIRRGTCTFVQKLTNVAAKKGSLALIYDNGSGFSAISVGNFTATLIQAADGVFLANAFAAGQKISLSFPQSGAAFGFPDPAGGLISSFSSFGPTNDLFFKPAIAAPGGNILSTLPVPLGSFGIESGTSMATPFMAGVSALLFGVKGRSPSVGTTARTLFETTAQKISSSHTDGDPLQSVAVQGGGLVDAFSAITTDFVVTPGEFLLNDTANFKPLQTFTVKNNGKKAKAFKLSHSPAGTALSLQPGTSFPADGPVPLSTQFATVKFSETSFTVHPGQTQKLTAHFTAPKGVDASVLPIFSGFIDITSADEIFHVSYVGVAASLKNAKVVDTTDTFFGTNLPALGAPDGTFISGPSNFTFVGADIPTLVMRLDFGTPKLRVDLVGPNIKIKTTLNQRDISPVLERSLFTFPNDAKGGSFAQVKTLGPLFEFDFIPRNSDVNDGSGFNAFGISNVFANNTVIPNGSYRILLRVLKVTGDPTKEEDFESWLSPVVGFQAPPPKQS
ncbi:subtilisin-like protease [Cristinia sonorae]|uniref:Subtilisin-like protease n=1 Tax=Cristinia sonorae TaxID=1940300 RepID=A0A8K0UZ31_9AGAR|nr:subtilisin-like protease [Cristinia sonorae]